MLEINVDIEKDIKMAETVMKEKKKRNISYTIWLAPFKAHFSELVDNFIGSKATLQVIEYNKMMFLVHFYTLMC